VSRSYKRSIELLARAQQKIPGGVNSPVRAYSSVGGSPPFIAKAAGPNVWDADGNRYIDYVGSWGPMILGHAHQGVIEAVQKAVSDGTSFGAPTEREIALAELVTSLYPSMDLVRMVSSGTEATMTAVRLARGATGRRKIIKFEGCYHGHGDAFLIKAGSGAATLGEPSSPGVTEGTAADTLSATYNDLESVKILVEASPDDVAAIIVEPVAGNMGCVPPNQGFLQGMRDLCDRHGVVLIFDEVMTGFRVALGGAQALYGITPDLTTLGKIIGGGMPVGAFGGRRELMEQIAPLGHVYQAGTLSGNPVAMAAGLATLSAITEMPDFYDQMETKARTLTSGMQGVLDQLNLNLKFQRVGSMGCLYFTEVDVTDWQTAEVCDTDRFGVYMHSMLDQGIYLAPSQFEVGFLSITHSDEDIAQTVDAAHLSLKKAYDR